MHINFDVKDSIAPLIISCNAGPLQLVFSSLPHKNIILSSFDKGSLGGRQKYFLTFYANPY